MVLNNNDHDKFFIEKKNISNIIATVDSLPIYHFTLIIPQSFCYQKAQFGIMDF